MYVVRLVGKKEGHGHLGGQRAVGIAAQHHLVRDDAEDGRRLGPSYLIAGRRGDLAVPCGDTPPDGLVDIRGGVAQRYGRAEVFRGSDGQDDALSTHRGCDPEAHDVTDGYTRHIWVYGCG